MDLYKTCFLISFLLVISLDKWFCLNNTLTEEISGNPTSKPLHEGYKARIANGSVTSLKDYSYNVYIFTKKKDGSGKGFSCGGAIIGAEWILTAGHCLPSDMLVENIRVYAGSKEKLKGTKYNVKRAIKHPSYESYLLPKTKKENHVYDYMLLELSQNLKYGQKVEKITAGKYGDIVTGKKAIFTGFGSISWPKSPPTSQPSQETPPNKFLRMAEFEISSHADCVSILSDLPAYEFCAVGASTSACQGDSGSPLVVNTNNGRRVIGVLSHGCRNAVDGRVINQFVSVPFIRHWISEVTCI